MSPKIEIAGFLLMHAAALFAISRPVQAATQNSNGTAHLVRDGSHDFDFDVGTWRADIIRYPAPFSDPNKTASLQGTITVHPIWNGRAELEEIEVPTPKGNWEAGSLYLYDPIAHQWSRNYVNKDIGRLDGSPKIGDLRDGKLVLYSQENFEGRSIFVRETFDKIEPNSHDYEEDYSADGGQVWHAAFKAHMTRIAQ